MKSIIIGGGKIGYYLLKTLLERNYQVTLIERDRDICKRIADDIDSSVICGDGTDLDVLKDAGIEDAEVVAAVTGNDEENLVICQIAKINFNINKTIARINNPKNISMFKALGVNKTVCSTEVIANLIEYEFEADDYKIIQTFERGSMLLAEITIENDNPWCNHFVSDLSLPEDYVLVSVMRSGKIIFPRGSTQILEDDRILFITNNSVLAELKKHLNSKGAKHEKSKK